jgi:8-oxo-dGTP pyrophosphatase MutT (NUDIX family)
MNYKIYFGDKPVFLCDDISSDLHEFLHHPDTIFIDEISRPALHSMLHEISKPDFHCGIIYSKDLEKLKKEFFKLFTIVEAAGGLVENTKKQILLIHRRGFWDLPKGKIDKGESPEQAAVREVEEETGLRNLSVGERLIVTYHTYHEFGKFILKPTYWYKMKVSGKQQLIPQTEEDISALKWVRSTEAEELYAEMYPSIRDVIKAAKA